MRNCKDAAIYRELGALLDEIQHAIPMSATADGVSNKKILTNKEVAERAGMERHTYAKIKEAKVIACIYTGRRSPSIIR